MTALAIERVSPNRVQQATQQRLQKPMNGSENTLTPAQILERYAHLVEVCPIITGQNLPTSTEQMIDTLRREIALARDRRNWTEAAKMAQVLGLMYFEKNNLFDALQRTSEAIALLRDAENQADLANTLGQLATIEYYYGDAEDALVHARESVQIAEMLKQPLLQGYYLTTVGAIECYTGEYKQSDETFKQAQAYFSRAEDDLGMAWWQFIQAREQARDRFQCAAAIKWLEVAVPVLREKKAGAPALIEALLALADSYLCNDNLSQGREILKQAEALITEGKRYWYRPELHLVKARSALAEHNYPQAAKYAYTGLGMAGDQGDLRTLATLYRVLASILERDRTRGEDTQDTLDRAIITGRKRARRLELALALRQAGNYFKNLANRPSVRARSSGFLFEAERMMQEMGIEIPMPKADPAKD